MCIRDRSNLVSLIPNEFKPILFFILISILLIDLYFTLNNLINFKQLNYNVQLSQIFINKCSSSFYALNIDTKLQLFKEKVNNIIKNKLS